MTEIKDANGVRTQIDLQIEEITKVINEAKQRCEVNPIKKSENEIEINRNLAIFSMNNHGQVEMPIILGNMDLDIIIKLCQNMKKLNEQRKLQMIAQRATPEIQKLLE